MNNKGLILISVLILINLIVLLITMGFASSELQMRMSNNQLQQAKLMQIAEISLKDASYALQQHAVACQIDMRAASNLAAMPSSWWHSANTCHGSTRQKNYFYVVEQWPSNKQFWRVTVRIEQSAKCNAVTIIQATFDLDNKTIFGMQSWHRLD